MLALKVVLARGSPVPTLVFDEVDAGIGGATAAAVGERLCRVASGCRCWW
jgi:DNA repair protein RecN (Recombination protein N)